MTLASTCILIACLLPSATIALAKAASFRSQDKSARYDNDNPRQWGARLSGWQQRANAAQMNGFEALPLFIAGVLLAQQAQADQATINALALSFIGIRVLYTAAYLLNWGALRSIIWFAGLGVSVALLTLG
ncbi:MAG: MAPEG family protein [Sterolibacterium sp.]|nr:MAPEG family protein [Sterolibacterium sp.]MBP9799879.1 MAPEG family protein [Sterolibacterium sp.]